jgi:hypothetical protein
VDKSVSCVAFRVWSVVVENLENLYTLPPGQRAKLYRELEAGARRSAARARDGTSRQTFLDIARGWKMLADGCEIAPGESAT